MPNKYIFADEAGCFNFERKQNVSKYFILCTVSMNDCSAGDALLELRRKLAWRKAPLGDFFHASEDKQEIRDAVFDTISGYDFQVQATIMEKSKALPQVRASKERFYKYGWYYHFKHGAKGIVTPQTEALVSAAALGTKKEKLSFTAAIDDVMRQTLRVQKWSTDFCPASADPCLQIADYCAWALQRKWERADTRSYNLIRSRITYEYDLWQRGATHHY